MKTYYKLLEYVLSLMLILYSCFRLVNMVFVQFFGSALEPFSVLDAAVLGLVAYRLAMEILNIKP